MDTQARRGRLSRADRVAVMNPAADSSITQMIVSNIVRRI